MNVITDHTLIDYVLDLLEESEKTVIEAEMTLSTELRSRVTSLRDALWVTPALTCEVVNPSGKLIDRLLKSIDPAHPFEGFVDRLTVFLDLRETQVRDLLNTIQFAHSEWDAIGIPGILGKVFDGGPRHAQSECSLVLMKPGAVIPKHGHLGDEWGFMLQGEAREQDGRMIHAGELVYQSEDSRHSLTNVGDKPVVFALVHRGLLFE